MSSGSDRQNARTSSIGHRAPSHGSTSSKRVERREVLVAAAGEAEQDEQLAIGSKPPARPSTPARTLGRAAIAWDVSSAGRMPSVRVVAFIAATASRSVAAATSMPPGLGQRRQLRPDARVVEPGRRAVGLDDLAVAVLEHQRARAVEDARRPAEDRRRVAAGLHAVAGGLGDGQADRRLADEPGQQPDGVRAAADAGQGEVRQAALDVQELGGRLVADPALEVAHDRRDTGAAPSPSPRT